MKSKIVFFILFLVSIFSCSKSNKKLSIEKNTPFSLDTIAIYNFINDVILDKNHSYNYCDTILNRKAYIIENEDFEFLNEIKNELSEADIESMKAQYKLGNTFIFEQDSIKDKILISPQSEEQYDRINCLGYVGVPLFNQDKSLAIIDISHSCGFLCGQSSIIVYKKDKNGEWEEYKYLLMVIS